MWIRRGHEIVPVALPRKKSFAAQSRILRICPAFFSESFSKTRFALGPSCHYRTPDQWTFHRVLLENGAACNTVNGRIRTCKVFFRYLYEEGIIPHNIADQFDLIIAEKKMIQTLTKEQAVRLLNQPDCETFSGLRDYTIILLLLETGMRISDCINLELDDINLKEQEIRIRLGKGRKARRVPIQKTCVKALKKYLEERGDTDTKALFVNIDSGPINKRTVQENIQKYGKMAQFTGARVSPHTFRRSTGTLCKKRQLKLQTRSQISLKIGWE